MVITRSNRGACDDAFRSALYTCAILNWRLASRCIADPSRCIAPRPPAESQPTAVLSTLCQQLEHVLASKANPTTKRDCLRSKPVRARRQIVQLQFAITSPNRMCLGAVREASDLSLLSMFVWRRVQVPYRPSLVRTCIGNCRTDNSSSSCAGFELSVLALKLQRRGVLFALPRLTRVPLHVSVSMPRPKRRVRRSRLAPGLLHNASAESTSPEHSAAAKMSSRRAVPMPLTALGTNPSERKMSKS